MYVFVDLSLAFSSSVFIAMAGKRKRVFSSKGALAKKKTSKLKLDPPGNEKRK